MPSTGRTLRVFYCFRDSPIRRAALAAGPGAPGRYTLHGLDELAARGVEVRHNLELAPRRFVARGADLASRGLHRVGGYGGDFASILTSRGVLNRADVVVSTDDGVGLPVVLLRRGHLVRPPVIYLAIGLPERLEQLGSERVRRTYAAALRGAHTIAAFSEAEVDAVRAWLERFGPCPRLEFLPFGVDVEHFRPDAGRPAVVDVLSIGADPHRDYELLLAVARRLPDRSFRIVASSEQVHALGALPPNVRADADLPFGRVPALLAEARIVALPVCDNSYSGATTVLLQAMATGKPVVVSQTAAIADGYGLSDGVNARLVAPGDEAGFEGALRVLLDAQDGVALRLGTAARETVVRSFGWDRYVNRIYDLVTKAAGESQ